MSNKNFNQLLDNLYAVIGNFDQWNIFAEKLSHFFNGNGCHILTGSVTDKEYSFTINYGMSQEVLFNLSELADHDPRIPMVLTVPGKVFSIGPDNEAFYNCRKFQEVLLPNDFIYSMGFAYPDGEGKLLATTILRSKKAGPFSSADREQLSELVPHLTRVIRLQKQFLQLDEKYWQSMNILNDINMGIIIADLQARILFENSRSKEIIDNEENLNTQHNILHSPNQHVSKKIIKYVAEQLKAAESKQSIPSHCLSIDRNNKAALLLRFQIINPNNPPFYIEKLSRPLVAIFISDPTISEETSTELLQRMFGFTVAEARLVANLVEGCKLEVAAKASGITNSTAYSYLKKIFIKTSVNSQPELIKRIVSSSAWIKVNSFT